MNVVCRRNVVQRQVDCLDIIVAGVFRVVATENMDQPEHHHHACRKLNDVLLQASCAFQWSVYYKLCLAMVLQRWLIR